MWSDVAFGGVFGIADDEAQMAEVMCGHCTLLLECWPPLVEAP